MFKKLFCNHSYVRQYKIKQYYDYNGTLVEVWQAYCPKCGKFSRKKYIRWWAL